MSEKPGLRHQEGKWYRRLFDGQPTAIYLLSEDGHIMDANKSASKALNRTHEDILSLTIGDIDPNFDKKTFKAFWSGHPENQTRVFESTHTKADGSIFPVEVAAFLFEDQGKRFLYGFAKDITERKQSENELKEKTSELEDINTALNILLKKREKDNQEMEQKLFSNYDLMILPFLHKLRSSLSDNHQQRLLDILEASLKEILSPFTKKLSDPLIMLTPSEIQIASMIKQGLANKEIAQTLNISKRTIETHRANIRKKLDLKNKKLNLKSYFSNL